MKKKGKTSQKFPIKDVIIGEHVKSKIMTEFAGDVKKKAAKKIGDKRLDHWRARNASTKIHGEGEKEREREREREREGER